MLQELTKKLISHKNLSEEEAGRGLDAILDEETNDVAIASFLTALSAKGETAAEIAGFVNVMRTHSIRIKSRHSEFIDTAGTGGGADTFNISTTAAFVIAGAGLPVAKHGNRAMTSRSGSADLLAALGVRIDAAAEVCERSLNEAGICFMFAPLFHPAMKRVAPIRKALGHRTIFNIIGPLTNPASAPYQVIGVYSLELTKKLADSLSVLGCRRAWVVHSGDGLDEISIGAPTHVAEVKDGDVTSFIFDPREFGFSFSPLDEIKGGTAEENAAVTRGILSGEIHGPSRNVVLLNAAAAIHVAENIDFAHAVERAVESMDSGAAKAKLRDLIESTSGKG